MGDRISVKQLSRGLTLVLALVLLSASLAAPAFGAADPQGIQDQLNKTAERYGKLETELAKTEAKAAKLEKDLVEADRIVESKTKIFKERAWVMYKSGGVGTYLEGLLTADDIRLFIKRIQLLEVMGQSDSKLVEELQLTKSRASLIREQLSATRAHQRRVLKDLAGQRRQLELQFKGAKAAARVSRFGDFDSFTLPVSPSAFANTWGAPRSGGRRHKGTDVMAPCGAPVVAVTNGVIIDMHSGGAGGIMLWLRAGNGDVFFYSHLRGYAGGSNTGKRVTTGELIAYNGNTGNARGGPCHVHFEWHPGGGSPVNPYPLLRAAA
jgi:murein DD-endopeptidase MepM/ murein hydrolase activator NlpD